MRIWTRKAALLGLATIVTGRLRGALALATLQATALACGGDGTRPAPIEVSEGDYVSSRTCRPCHPREYGTWHGSYHRTMTQEARRQAILAPWDGRALSLYGQTWRLEQRDGQPWVRRVDVPGEFPVVLTTGSHHFQAYWLATGSGRKVRLFPFAYHLRKQRWVPFDTIMLAPALPQYRQGTTEGGEWNLVCVQCHTTAPRPRRLLPGGVDTHVGEFGIACEACHGPSAEHVAVNRNPLRRYRLHLTGGADPTVVLPSRLDHRRSSEVCGQCHSVRLVDPALIDEAGFRYRPGDVLDETRPVIHEDGRQTLSNDVHTRFWLDGRARVGGREYNGLVRSPCFQRGDMSCQSCHRMHQDDDDARPLREWANDQLAPGMDGARACLQCHPRFAADPVLVEHTKLAPLSAGSDCLNCHMPYTAWGLQKATRSHEIASPSVQESVAVGRPNACNGCHLDQTLGWAAGHLERWYGIAAPDLPGTDADVAAGVRWLVAGDAGQRALIAWSMGWEPAQQASGSAWMVPHLTIALQDPYAVVQWVALESLRSLEGFEDLEVDLTLPPERREAAMAHAVERFWRRGAARSEAGRADLLISGEGTLEWQRYLALQSLRNDRLMYLME